MRTTSWPGWTFAPTRTTSSAKRSRRSSGVIARDDSGIDRRSCRLLLAPVEVARAAPEAVVERGALDRLVLAGPRERLARLGGGHTVERLLEAGLLLRLEQRVVLEGVLDLVAVERHVAVERGVSLLQVEVLLDRARQGRCVVFGALVGREGVFRNAGVDCHSLSVTTLGRVTGHAA